jgi:hypothetical protein
MRELNEWAILKRNMKRKLWELMKNDRTYYEYYKRTDPRVNQKSSVESRSNSYWCDENGKRTHAHYAKQLKTIWNFDWRALTSGTKLKLDNLGLSNMHNQKKLRRYSRRKSKVLYDYNGNKFQITSHKKDPPTLWEILERPIDPLKKKKERIREAIEFYYKVVLSNWEIPEFNLIKGD